MIRKVFFYGHSAGLGAGHFVRSLRLAEAAQDQGWEVRVLGGGEALKRLNRRSIPELKLPELLYGTSAEANLDTITQRSRQLLNFLREWSPDLVVVDLLPFGYGGELTESLLSAQREHWSTKFVWGLPYAEVASRPPKNPRLAKALSAYSSMLVYSEPNFLDPRDAYEGFQLPQKLFYTGVVIEKLELTVGNSRRLKVVGLLGSGGLKGGLSLFQAMADCTPAHAELHLLTGPLAEASQFEGLTHPNLVRHREGPLTEALQDAALVVSRVGYNTAFALIQTDLPLIFVPTAWPEQFERAGLLESLPGVEVCSEDELGSKLSTLIHTALVEGPQERDLPFRIDGARRAITYLEQVSAAV